MIQEIKEIVNNQDLNDDVKKVQILNIFAKNEKAFDYIMYMLSQERERNHNVLIDMNNQLSRLVYFASQPKRKWFGEGFSFQFIVNEMVNFYKKYQGEIKGIGPRNNEEINIFPRYLK